MDNSIPSKENSAHVVTKTRSKLPFIIAFVCILVLIPAGVFVYAKVVKNEPKPSPTPLVFSTPTPTPSPSTILGGLKTFENKKISGFSGFTLSYPQDWALTEDRNEKTSSTQVSLEKKGYAIVIIQGDTDGAPCAYSDTKIPSGETRFIDERDKVHTEIKTGFGLLRRAEEKTSDGLGYSFCQEKEEDGWRFGAPTNIGHISYGGPAKWEDGVLDEMDKIIESIKELDG